MKNSFILIMSLCLVAMASYGKDSDASQVESAPQLPKLLDLGAHKCIPCIKMAPVLDELSQEFAGVLEVQFIDVWEPANRAKAKAYGIKSIPTQIFFDAKGQELWRHEGFLSKEDILKKWKELGFTFKAVPVEKEPSSISCCTQ